MADVQPQFFQFHDNIKLSRFEENKTLRDKRNIIRDKLNKRLPGVFEEHEEECPEFWFYDQGSYDLGTGIKPIEGDYDIDQGIYFKTSTATYSDPVVLKQRVHKALDGHTKSVTIRRPCVTVQYECDGEPAYHVDLAVYSDSSANDDGKSYLARGKEGSAPEQRTWEVDNPQDLAELIFDRFTDDDRAQFRRVVRYLKRWKDENFPRKGNAAPRGIGLTVATYDDLQVRYSDLVARTPDDLGALRDLVEAILGRFGSHWNEKSEAWERRLVVKAPVEAKNDLFAKMTKGQMESFEERLKGLRDALNFAITTKDPVAACKELQKVFGSDFPVPEKEETAKKHAPAVSSSGHSA